MASSAVRCRKVVQRLKSGCYQQSLGPSVEVGAVELAEVGVPEVQGVVQIVRPAGPGLAAGGPSAWPPPRPDRPHLRSTPLSPKAWREWVCEQPQSVQRVRGAGAALALGVRRRSGDLVLRSRNRTELLAKAVGPHRRFLLVELKADFFGQFEGGYNWNVVGVVTVAESDVPSRSLPSGAQVCDSCPRFRPERWTRARAGSRTPSSHWL